MLFAKYSPLAPGCGRGEIPEGVPDRHRGGRGDRQRPHHRHRHPRGRQVPGDEEVAEKKLRGRQDPPLSELCQVRGRVRVGESFPEFCCFSHLFSNLVR